MVAAARQQGVDPVAAMVDLLLELRTRARTVRPNFVLVAQNAAELVGLDPRFQAAVDAVAQEDLSFRGEAGAAWDDTGAGDIATSDADAALLAERLRACRRCGLSVFTLDYARLPSNAELARQRARAVGAVPCVSRVTLDRLDPQWAAPAR